jgi:hypothetical protein
MQTEVIVALVGVVGIILGAIVTQLFARRKIDAEIEKIRAETEKARAESDKLRAEIVHLAAPAKNKISNKKDNRIVGNNLMPHPASSVDAKKSIEYKKHPSPVEILSEFDKLSEYQIALSLESYKDLKIKWYLELNSLSFKDDMVTLSLFPIETIRVLILTNVNILDCPELKRL